MFWSLKVQHIWKEESGRHHALMHMLSEHFVEVNIQCSLKVDLVLVDDADMSQIRMGLIMDAK